MLTVQDTGCYPSRTAEDRSERSPSAWLQRRREDAWAGRLASAFREGLAVLPGWEGKPRVRADEERWQGRFAALTAYRGASNDLPRHKAVITGEEHGLGVWLHKQRRGELGADKAAALDAALPGWRTGRKRGQPPSSGFQVPGSEVEDLPE